MPARIGSACWLSSPAVGKPASGSASSSLQLRRGGLRDELCRFCAVGAIRLICREAPQRRGSTPTSWFLLLPPGGETGVPSHPILLSQSVLDCVDSGCPCSRMGVSSRSRRLRWGLIFDGLVHAYCHSYLSFLILSIPSSPEMLCPPTQSAPSTLAPWAASQQRLGAHHCSDILK